jgi:glycopeptide antibiotics resistance protein
MRSAGGRAGVDSGQRQPGRSSRWVQGGALAYVVVLAVVTLLPVHWTLGLSRAPRNYEPQLVPFGGIRGDFHNSPVEALAELVGNVLLFAPFGFLLPLLVPAMRRWGRVLAAGAAVSLAIELYQLAWPGVRKASVNDVWTNALGALLGFATLRLTEALRSRRLR